MAEGEQGIVARLAAGGNKGAKFPHVKLDFLSRLVLVSPRRLPAVDVLFFSSSPIALRPFFLYLPLVIPRRYSSVLDTPDTQCPCEKLPQHRDQPPRCDRSTPGCLPRLAAIKRAARRGSRRQGCSSSTRFRRGSKTMSTSCQDTGTSVALAKLPTEGSLRHLHCYPSAVCQ